MTDTSLSPDERAAFEAWQKDHPDAPEKSWHELPYWVQTAYLHYVTAE